MVNHLPINSCIFITTLIVIALGCMNDGEQRYKSAIRSGRADIPLVSELHQLLNGRACDTILYFDSNPTWDLTFTLYDRYELSVHFPVEIDKTGTIKPTGEATCYITEVRSIKMNGPGPGNYSIENGDSWEISSKDLLSALESTEDFDVLEIPLLTDEPVVGFHRVKALLECQ
ncbi:hypothetical protein N8590_03090 [bacterium]|nr:hypothetical protein [bacterium]MDB4793372.1 hypothetical protein [bacterium]